MIKNKLVEGYGFIGTESNTLYKFGNGKYKTFEGTEISIENCVRARVKDLVVEGKTIQDPEDLSNIESVAEKEGNVLSIVNKGKNLFNIHEWYGSCIWYNITNEEIIYLLSSSASVNVHLSKTNKLSKGVYRISLQGEGENVAYSRIEVYSVIDDISTKIADTNINTELYNSLSFTLDEDTYIKFKFFVVNSDNTVKEGYKLKNIQLEEGTVATSYEPYREPVVTNINLPIPLRSLPNGVCDTIEGDKLVQRVGKVVLDGSFVPVAYKTNVEGKYRWLVFKDDSIKNLIPTNITYVYCDKYKATGVLNTYSGSEGIAQRNVEHNIILYLEKYSDGSAESKNALIEELKANPATVYYILETPIIHSLEIPQLATTKGTNVITTTNNIKPNLKIKVKVK